MSESLALRQSVAGDLETVLAFVRDYHALEGIVDPGTHSAEVVGPLLGDSLVGRLWLIELDRRPVGYVVITFGYSIEFGGRDAFIDEFFIAGPCRGQGHGARTLELLCSAARELGVRALHLEVARDNRARRLYNSAGFTLREHYHLMSLQL